MNSSLSQSTATILVVDDTPANISVLLGLLNEQGHKVLVADDGASALEQLKHVRPDLILLDVMMPGLDGFEVCRRIKQLPDLAEIPILFLTALDETEEKLKDPARSAENKKGIIESKLETLVEDPTFKACLEQQLAAFQKEKDRIKNVMVGGSIDAKQDVHVGDTEGGNDVGLTKKNVLENVTVKTDGSFHLGDGK